MGKDQSPITKILMFLGVAVILGFAIKFGLLRIINPEDYEPQPPPPNLPPPNAEYDWEASKKDLEAIGRAIQLYREDVGIKPVNQRKTLADAGLPTRQIKMSLTIPNQKWSLAPSIFNLEVAPGDLFTPEYQQPSRVFSLGRLGVEMPTPFPAIPRIVVFYDDPSVLEAVSSEFRGFRRSEAPKLLQSRGEELPILIDPYVGTILGKDPDPKHAKVLLLRLNGRVDLVKTKDLDLRRIALED